MSDAQYLIRKHGRYYRPNSQGYTASAIQAGRYTLAEAVLITHPNGPNGPRDGMTYVHEDEVRDDDLVAYRFLQVENAALQARADAAEAALIRAKVGLVQARDELDQYSRQEYPLDHPVHERYRQRDYEANPARLALDALSVPADLAKRLGVSHEPT